MLQDALKIVKIFAVYIFAINLQKMVMLQKSLY